ncbi:MAG: hypothetical protein J1E96_03265 [Ruminococcus sp.]|nr:hypothetical protein [Ruminococcus sp.]
MNKFKKTLPAILAVLLMALCYFGIELSQTLLPNYKNTLEKVDNSQRISLLYFDNTASPELYPMNIYDSKIVKKVKSKYLYKCTKELVVSLMNSFCPDVYFSKDFNFGNYLEYLDTTQTDIYYLKDVKFTATNKRKYTLNVAFTSVDVLFFSCIPEHSGKISSKQIENAYEKLENDFKMYPSQEYDYFKQQGGSYNEINSIIHEFGSKEFNNFVHFLVCFKKIDKVCKKLDMNSSYATVAEIIDNSTSSSISYNEMMYLTFTDKNYQLIMIYDPNILEFVGFSLSERN